MDTRALIDELVAARGWKPAHQDELDGETVVFFGIDDPANGQPVTFTPGVTSVIVRARHLAQTGGRNSTFDPAIAALVATLAYHYDVQIGVDLHDGEVEVRMEVELAGVADHLRAEVLRRGVDGFLFRLTRVVRRLLAYRAERGESERQQALCDDSLDLSA